MRSSILLPLLAVAGRAVAAKGTMGFSLGDKKADGSCKDETDYDADFKAIAANTEARIVRTYAASECNSSMHILPAAKTNNFKVVLGIWADVDESYNNDKAAIVKYAPQYKDQVYAVTVGSESLYRGAFTGDQLLTKIKDMKKALGTGFKVGTADSWNKYNDGTADALIKEGGADILLCNAFSYWQGESISNATFSFYSDIFRAFSHIQSINPNVELWVGETGWTSDGDKYEAAVPSVENAKLYFSRAVCSMINWGYNIFYFEAFDEPWKPKSVGANGQEADETHWGAMDVNRKPKYSLTCPTKPVPKN